MRAHRKERVASAVHHIVGEAILHRLSDPRVAPLTTVTRVVVTGDLLIAKVYLSVQGDEAAERRTLLAVRGAGGYLQRLLARELTIRQCPELRFEIDEAAKGTRRTLELLAENRRREPEVFAPHNQEDGMDIGQKGAADPPQGGPIDSFGVGE